MKDGRPYKCSCSVFALNIIDILSPSVPICSRQVEEIKCMLFLDGQPPSVDNQHEMCVEVAKKDLVMQQAWGSLRQISPIEMTVAMLRACVRDVESPVDHSAEWEKCLRSIPMSFKFCENSEATFMHSVTLRQQAMQSGISLQRTPLQWAIELVDFRETLASQNSGKAVCAATVAS